jgi:uncharacterized protein (UPF0276 family)
VAAGVGLRFRHHQVVVDTRPEVVWFEVHTENYMGGGKAPAYLDAIRRDYPLSLHGVGLSLGSAEGLDNAHLERVRLAIQRFEPGLVSEHLAWSVVDGGYLADLLPLPMTEEALDLFCRNVDQTQAHLKRRILIENPSSYLRFRHSTIPEWEFLAAVAERTGCGILCDVNNIYVSASNHDWDASAYLAALPVEAVGEIHLAGQRIGLPRRVAGRSGWRDPLGRPLRAAGRRRTGIADRRPWLTRRPRGLGALCEGSGALWYGANVDRMGHRRSGAGRIAR